MKFTPLDIRQKRFETSFRGYAARDVQGFLELLAAEFEDVVKENIGLKEELKRTQVELERHLERERALQQTLVTAQRVSEDLRDAAKKEAEIVVAEAELQSEKIVHAAHQKLVQVVDDICDIFHDFGFAVVSGPEMETEHHNFEALNIPKDHPSRDSFDTFYLDNGNLLRSQTSTVQIRVMEKVRPPLKVIAPGKVYRPDATDASHSFMFHQIEGLMVDERVSFAELKGVLFGFAQVFFGKNVRLRFRPHFFPFTEPSAEVDVSCVMCQGKGCRVCSQKGWLEILGAGMVHPRVFEAVGISPERYTGLAFGMGVERIAMLKWGVADIRLFYENDLRFLRQLG